MSQEELKEIFLLQLRKLTLEGQSEAFKDESNSHTQLSQEHEGREGNESSTQSKTDIFAVPKSHIKITEISAPLPYRNKKFCSS